MSEVSRSGERGAGGGHYSGSFAESHREAGAVESWLSSGLAVLDEEGRTLSASETLANWLGTPTSELKGRELARELGKRHPEWEKPIHEFIQRKEGFDRIELSAVHGSSHERVTIELCARPDARFLHLESVMPSVPDFEELFPASSWGRVISSRAFHRMLRSETQLDNVMQRWPGILFSQRPDFSFAFMSPKIEELTGIPAPEFQRQSRHFWETVHEADAELLERRLKAEGESPGGLTNVFRIRHVETGRVTYLWEHRRAVRTSNGLLLGFEGIWMDITRQTFAEKRLLNMSWRENVGLLTVGLAHDFCNIMTGIVGLSETFEAAAEANSPLQSGLGLIRDTAMQASGLAHRIRQLHQGVPGRRSYQDLNESVRNLADLLQKVLPRRVKLTSTLAEGQLPIYVDAVELQQVIVNLALNAADAMPEGGVLNFRTQRHVQLPALENLRGTHPRTPAVSLAVEDTGTGIAPRLLGSLFDPFFTTKPLGKGSGLGLYNARLFVEKHQAAISVRTSEDKGSTFELWLPESDFTEDENAGRRGALKRQTLLVTGASGERLETTVRLLREAGFYVVRASGEEASTEALQAPHYELSGVVALTTPGYGDEIALCQRVRAHRLPLKIVLVLLSGATDEMPHTIAQASDSIVPADATPQELVDQVRSVLNRDS